MLKLPDALLKKYHSLLIKNEIHSHVRGNYKKWLRFYLDFCNKYQYPYSDSGSLSLFLDKLVEKRQPPSLLSQAKHAVEIYYSGITPKHMPAPSGDEIRDSRPLYKTTENHAPWTDALNSLSREINLRHYSPKTLKSYSLWADKLKRFTKFKPPKDLEPSDVKEFLTYLAVDKKVSASSQNQAFNALLFFFRHVLKKEFGKMDGVVRAKRKPYIPVVLSRDEIDCILKHLTPPYELVVKLLYGCGLRLGECMKLRINNFNFDFNVLTIHDGKGKKDRTVPLPESIKTELNIQVDRVITLHQKDLTNRFDGVFMPGALEKKYGSSSI